jgi:hypothetical protein
MVISAFHYSALVAERRRELLAQADAARLARDVRKARRRDRLTRNGPNRPPAPLPATGQETIETVPERELAATS